MDHGHRWPDIQEYTLAEIGIFIRAVLRKKARKRASDFSLNWLSNHLQHKGYEKVLKELKKPPGQKEEEATPAVVQSNWKKLSALMQGLR